jgi:hypothetical protein
MASVPRSEEDLLLEIAEELLAPPSTGETLPPDLTEEEWVVKFMAKHGPGYYYYHTNGSLHFKPASVMKFHPDPCAYFSSPFVKEWWYMNRDGFVWKP